MISDSANGFKKELNGWENVRPVRIAYLVDNSEYATRVLDAVFADSYARWGGRFSLIVPCADDQIISEYWPWLETFDPDLIYSYVKLPHEAVLELHERLTPADYVFHEFYKDRGELIAASLRPRHHFVSLSSLSTIFRLGRHAPIGIGPKIKIIDSWFTEKPSRLLTDNFGTYHGSAATGIYPNDAQATAGLLTIVSDEFFDNREYGVPKDLDRVANEYQAFKEFLNNRATSMSMLSSLYGSRVEVVDRHWGDSFNLVVGETFEDRLMFWNARLLLPTWLDSELCCFRVSLEDLKDEDFITFLASLINLRNHVNSGNGGQAQLKIRSASHSEDELTPILGILRRAKLWGPSGIQIVPMGHVLPSQESTRHAREMLHVIDGSFRGVESRSFGWTPPIARVPGSSPDHLRDAPSKQSFTLGNWAVDLSFEHEENETHFGGHNIWMLPKRWRMDGGFHKKYSIRGFGQQPSPLSRTSRLGKLTVFAGADMILESIIVPSTEDAMRSALCEDSVNRRVNQDGPPWAVQKAKWIRSSNEADYLVGVLGLVGGLSRAGRLLLHPFLQKMFADLGGTPNLADADVRGTVDALVKRTGRRSVFDLHEHDERTALAALIVKAAQSVKAPKMNVSLDELRHRWDEYSKSYWVANKDALAGAVGDADEWHAEEKQVLNDCLGDMRRRRMIFQGYPWKCRECQHKNWSDFQVLKPTLKCDVCSTETELPVGVPWHFRANEFLIESLRSHSVLSLIWVLTVLTNRATQSFIYSAPTCFGYTKDNTNPDAEADLLAVLDGKTILCEIKSAWRSLRIVHVADFVALALRLRPDLAMLAIMEDGRRLSKEIDAAERELNEAGIKFELLTVDEVDGRGAPYLLG